MNDFVKTIEANKRLIAIVIAVLMFILFSFCSAVDIAGKAQASGFKVVLDGRGLGFSRFLSAIIILLPVIIVVANFVNIKVKENLKQNLDTLCFAAGLLSCLILAVVLPEGISLAWGSWLYVILAIGGTAVSCIEKLVK